MVYDYTFLRDGSKSWKNDLDCAICGRKCDGTTGFQPGINKSIVIICDLCSIWTSHASQHLLQNIQDWAQYDPWNMKYCNGITPDTHASFISQHPVF